MLTLCLNLISLSSKNVMTCGSPLCSILARGTLPSPDQQEHSVYIRRIWFPRERRSGSSGRIAVSHLGQALETGPSR